MFIIHLFTHLNMLPVGGYNISRHSGNTIANWFISIAYLLHCRTALDHDSVYPYLSEDTFRAFCDFIIDDKTTLFNPHEVTNGDIIFVRSSLVKYFFDNFHPYIKSKYILITHKGTSSIPGAGAQYLDDDTLIAWFGKNVTMKHPKLFPIPLGTANKRRFFEDADIFNRIVAEFPIKKDKLLYMNFSTETNPGVRNKIERSFAHKSFCYRAERKSFPLYLQDLASSKFVLSPTGKGLDCYRTWEALLMGSIPIVQRSAIDELFDDLPVLIVDDWKDITEGFLEKKYKEMSSKTYSRSKLYADYWFNKINLLKHQARSITP